MDTFYSGHFDLVPKASALNSFYYSCTLIVQLQPGNNCSKSTVSTRIFFLLFLLLTLNRSPLTGNGSSYCYIFMLITVTHNIAVTHIIHWKKIRKLFGKSFQKLIIWNKILQKALVKTNRVSKFMLSVQKLCCS